MGLIALLFFLVLLSGCGNGFNANSICEKIPGVLDASIGQTIAGSVCSDSLKQGLSSEEIAAIEKTDYAGVLADNSIVDFSCTIKSGFFGAKSYSLDYLTSNPCENGFCIGQTGTDGSIATLCGNESGANASLCNECNDEDPCTLDVCIPTYSGQPACSFVSRCPNEKCTNGNCEEPNPCGNGICEASENSSNCPDDCRNKTECSDGGFTGADAAPRNKFSWAFSGIASNECDSDNPNHSNCDMTQFLIAFFQKMSLTENYFSQNTLSNPVSIENAGTLKPQQNGFDLEFNAAFLSDNLSYQLLWDFGHRESDFFDEPSWFKEKWKKYLMSEPENSPILIEYDSPSLNALSAIHEAGIYSVKIEIRFNSTSNSFFVGAGSGLQPNATIKIILNRTGPLTDTSILDLALNGDLGSGNAWKDYGIQWEQRENQAPTAIAFAADLPGTSFLDSGGYRYGLGFVSILETEDQEPLTAPAFFQPSTIPASLEEPLFFNEAPVLMQTIENAAAERSSLGIEKEYGLFFKPMTAVPLLAFVSPNASIGLGAHGGTANLGFWGPWMSITQQASNCESNGLTPTINNQAVSCGENNSPTVSNGLLIQNDAPNAKLFFNLGYGDYTTETVPMIELCNSGAEIASLSGLASSQNKRVELSNEQFRIRSIQELIEGIKTNKVCVNTESYETPTEDTETGFVSSQITKTTYTFNTQALFSQIKPRLEQYLNNNQLGSFTYCG